MHVFCWNPVLSWPPVYSSLITGADKSTPIRSQHRWLQRHGGRKRPTSAFDFSYGYGWDHHCSVRTSCCLVDLDHIACSFPWRPGWLLGSAGVARDAYVAARFTWTTTLFTRSLLQEDDPCCTHKTTNSRRGWTTALLWTRFYLLLFGMYRRGSMSRWMLSKWDEYKGKLSQCIVGKNSSHHSYFNRPGCCLKSCVIECL